MTQKNISHRRITVRIFFLGFVSAVFCSLVGFSFFGGIGWSIPVLFLCFLLLSLSLGTFKKPLLFSFLFGTILSSLLFFWFQNTYEKTYEELPVELSGNCTIQEKLSETTFVCDMGNLHLVLLASSGNTIHIGDSLRFTAIKKELTKEEKYRLFSEKEHAKYTLSESTVTSYGEKTFRAQFLAKASGIIFALFPPREASLLE